jgi:hypothetical protein
VVLPPGPPDLINIVSHPGVKKPPRVLIYWTNYIVSQLHRSLSVKIAFIIADYNKAGAMQFYINHEVRTVRRNLRRHR